MTAKTSVSKKKDTRNTKDCSQMKTAFAVDASPATHPRTQLYPHALHTHCSVQTMQCTIHIHNTARGLGHGGMSALGTRRITRTSHAGLPVVALATSGRLHHGDVRCIVRTATHNCLDPTLGQWARTALRLLAISICRWHTSHRRMQSGARHWSYTFVRIPRRAVSRDQVACGGERLQKSRVLNCR